MGPVLKPSRKRDQRRTDSRAGGCSGMGGMANPGSIEMLRAVACAVLLAPLAPSAQARNSKNKSAPLPVPAEKSAPPLPGASPAHPPPSEGPHLGLYRLVRSNE